MSKDKYNQLDCSNKKMTVNVEQALVLLDTRTPALLLLPRQPLTHRSRVLWVLAAEHEAHHRHCFAPTTKDTRYLVPGLSSILKIHDQEIHHNLCGLTSRNSIANLSTTWHNLNLCCSTSKSRCCTKARL